MPIILYFIDYMSTSDNINLEQYKNGFYKGYIPLQDNQALSPNILEPVVPNGTNEMDDEMKILIDQNDRCKLYIRLLTEENSHLKKVIEIKEQEIIN